MIIITGWNEAIDSPRRQILGRVSLYRSGALITQSDYKDTLKDIRVERIGEKGKFFGFGICHKATVNILDNNRELEILKGDKLQIELGVKNDYAWVYSDFIVEEVKRDENTNAINIIAYDAIYNSSKRLVKELALRTNYTIAQFAEACASLIGLPLNIDDSAGNSFDTLYPDGANFEGSETIRYALNAIAEATQTIYYISDNLDLTFKRLSMTGDPVYTIDKSKYFKLDSKAPCKLTKIVSTNELGDAISSSTGEDGVTQYVRDNPFWELRNDRAELVDKAIEAVGGLTLVPFTCDWRQNFFLEVCDKIAVTTKDDSTITAFVLDEVIEYNGGMGGKTQWEYTDTPETEDNPTSLGEIVKQTYAKVDKVNKQVEIVASSVQENKTEISTLKTNSDSISASVKNIEDVYEPKIDELGNEILNLTSKISEVETKVTTDGIRTEVKNVIEEDGVSKIVTGKGYTFDDNGFTVEDLNPETNNKIKTTITNNGMKVNSSGTDVLTANDSGVKAKDLHAVTYLIMGQHSRFEDYESNRTACFWID